MSKRFPGWHDAVHVDRVQASASASASTGPASVRGQGVDAAFWRVVDAGAAWDDPSVMLGAVERSSAGFDCTLMAALHEHHRVGALPAANTFVEDARSSTPRT